MRKEEGGGKDANRSGMDATTVPLCMFSYVAFSCFLFLHLHVNRKYKHLLLPGIGYQQDKVAKQVASCTYITAPAVQPGEECE